MEKYKLLLQNCPPNFPGQNSHQGINGNKEILKFPKKVHEQLIKDHTSE